MAPARKSAKPKVEEPPASGKIKIRMYRQGLGDCFLLTFPGEKGKLFRLLIDCGVVLGTDAQGLDKLHQAVADLAHETRGHVDLLVVSHEHWDHVSGFTQARDLFANLNVDQVWVAWTEDPDDKLATKLRKERKAAQNALRMAASRLAVIGSTEAAQRVSSLLGFLGAKAGSTDEAFTYAKDLAKKSPRYCQPGEPPIELPTLPGIRFWILGPPKDEKLIKKSDPGKTAGYGLDAGPGGSQAPLIAAMVHNMDVQAGTAAPDSVSAQPFESRFAIPTVRAMQIPFFEKAYFGESTDGSLWLENQSGLRDQSWRRIDGDWLGASETLALALDSATNNTSLVLAIEIAETGDVMLFPGDAQAGNWLSWQDLSWKVKNNTGAGAETVSGPDLLARTLFYKVGHHGSHNATLREKGLELMTREDLIAMIPVDHAMAVKKHWARMPLPELVARLTKKTGGRLLKIDDAAMSNSDLSKAKPDGISAKEWREFTDKVKVDPLYFELSL